MDLGRFGRKAGAVEKVEEMADPAPRRPLISLDDAAGWLRRTNKSRQVVDLIRRARRVLPGDPEFGDPLSTVQPQSA